MDPIALKTEIAADVALERHYKRGTNSRAVGLVGYQGTRNIRKRARRSGKPTTCAASRA